MPEVILFISEAASHKKFKKYKNYMEQIQTYLLLDETEGESYLWLG